MSFLINNPTNLELASQLKKDVLLSRDNIWISYVNQLSSLYQLPKANFELSHKKTGLDKFDRKFLLIQSRLEDITQESLKGNYGYILAPGSHQLFLVIPTQPIRFEQVKDDTIKEGIFNIIQSKNDSIREASDQEMDCILDLFYTNDSEALENPEYLTHKKSQSYCGDGKFRSARHAPNIYAFKKFVSNSVSQQLKVEKDYRRRINTNMEHINSDQTNANVLLNISWFSRAKENFSWEPLAELISPNEFNANVILNMGPALTKVTSSAILAMKIEEELAQDSPNFIKTKALLEQLKADHKVNGNGLTKLVISIGGVVASPVALLMGLAWVIPALIIGSPYFGKPAFFIDAFQWFAESLLNTIQLIIFPLAMMSAYNHSGSMDIRENEFNRVIETLLSRMGDEVTQEEYMIESSRI